jgi:subtilisin family serine protease
VRAQKAQSISTGTGVIVAVIDTGVDYRHPELAAHMLRDSNNRIAGYDFVQNDTDPMDSTNGIDDDNDGFMDEGAGHGTHVAGIIRLIAPSAKIMPLRVLNSDGVGAADAVARAIEYAIEYREDSKKPLIINLSLGFPTPSFIVQDAIEEAAEEGVPVIASAGNDHGSAHYPAAHKNVISVTAIGPNGVKAPFANFGKVDLSAPGLGIYSTYLNGRYAWWSGTSMAAPFVSGEAALVMSMKSMQRSDDDPRFNILPILNRGVDYIYGVNPKYRAGNRLGSGSVDVYGTLAQMRGADHITIVKAGYAKADRTLNVVARSSKAPSARLTVAGLGPMKYNSSAKTYEFSKRLDAPKTSVAISSSAGGVVTVYIASR